MGTLDLYQELESLVNGVGVEGRASVISLKVRITYRVLACVASGGLGSWKGTQVGSAGCISGPILLCVSIAMVEGEEAVDLGGANRKGRDGGRRKERKEKMT